MAVEELRARFPYLSLSHGMASARPIRTIRRVKKYGFDASSDESEDEEEQTREVDLDIGDDSESSDEEDDRMPSSKVTPKVT